MQGDRGEPIGRQRMATAIRVLAMDAVQRANSGHPGMPMGMADVATVLFARFLKYDPGKPDWPDRDRFVLSAGHGSMLIYALLHLTGYEAVSMQELENFRQFGSKTAGHPEYGHLPGVEVTTGPLGQGIATAVGLALGERMRNARFSDDLVDHRTYVMAGDGCLMEGISQEAITLAGHWKLGRLIVLWDDNHITIDGKTDLSTSEDTLRRFQAAGWDTRSCDGHDMDAIAAAIEAAQQTDTPSLIACRTIIGKGAPNKAGSHSVHGAPLGDEEIAAARTELDWPHAPFVIPDDVRDGWRAAGARGAEVRAAWEGRLAAQDSAVRAAFERGESSALPADLDAKISAFKAQMSAEAPALATRQASGKALEVLTAALPEMIGGSADLTGSVNTRTKEMSPLSAEDYCGNYIHYGVREHAMGAVMNGLSLHGGFIPYGGTFLVFSDYNRPAIRLGALMGVRVVHIMTHDSIGLGEDGPTHQPVEHVPSLRAMPNLALFRPADVVEAMECWQVALRRADGPSMLVLSRQKLPTVRTTHTDDNLCARGGYVLREAEGGERRVTLMATGSEVSLALEARDALQADGVPTALVSMPCTTLFDDQDPDYRRSVLAPGTVRVAVEAAIGLGWDKYIGENGAFIGMTGFGASAPAPRLFEHFGITAAGVVAAAKDRL